MDIDGPWCFYRRGPDDLRTLIDGLRPFESKTWAEIEGQRDHAISCDSIMPTAQDRLRAINQDDISDLFSLHLNGKIRIWGIRDGATFRLLWWDPDHQICPSVKRHT